MGVNLITISKKYNTQAKCLKLLETIRWGKTVKCPYCGSKVTRKVKSETGRHACNNCKRSFTVFIDTIFEGTRLPLPQWFMLIGSVLNSKSGVSAKELQRNYEMSYKTAYYTAMRIRVGMLLPDTQLHGILEMDESYFGGKKRTRKSPSNEANLSTVALKRGRGTSKISVAGIVERKGNVDTKVIEKLTKKNLLAMIKRDVDTEDSVMVTDGFKSYAKLNDYVEHLTVNHSKKQYVKGIAHVNTIEGFWSYVKNGIKGSYKSISPKYLPLYLIEYEWKYNHRNLKKSELETFLKNALTHEKDLSYWKAESKAKVKEIAYD